MADMTTQAIRIAAKIWPDHQCKIRVGYFSRGHAHAESRLVSIPRWVMNSTRPGYVKYYIAHELAHVHSGSELHDAKFYDSFKLLCPKSYFKFEHQYKPRNAKTHLKERP